MEVFLEKKSLFDVNITAATKETATLLLIDATGKVVETKSVNIENGTTNIIWHPQQVNAGAYFIKVQMKEFVQTIRLINPVNGLILPKSRAVACFFALV